MGRLGHLPGARGGRPDDVRADDRRFRTTSGPRGILQGTYETLAECAHQHFGGSLAGTITLTGGLGGMGGAQPQRSR
ncbi:MAG: hypothetical protein U0V56_00570 [Actinomycetota bacterium]